MRELIRFQGRNKTINIPQRICTKWYDFGIFLLSDDSGAKVCNIAETNRDKPEEINRDILAKWIQGQGLLPVTWETLVGVLRDIELNELAKDIASVKCTEPVINPSVTSPGVTDSSVTSPSVTDPSVTSPGVTDPSVSSPSVINPSDMSPGVINPSVTSPGVINPSVTSPGVINPVLGVLVSSIPVLQVLSSIPVLRVRVSSIPVLRVRLSKILVSGVLAILALVAPLSKF